MVRTKEEKIIMLREEEKGNKRGREENGSFTEDAESKQKRRI